MIKRFMSVIPLLLSLSVSACDLGTVHYGNHFNGSREGVNVIVVHKHTSSNQHVTARVIPPKQHIYVPVTKHRHVVEPHHHVISPVQAKGHGHSVRTKEHKRVIVVTEAAH